MRRYFVGATLLVATVFGGTAAGATLGDGTPTEAVQPAVPACTPLKAVYAESNWRKEHPERGMNICPVSNDASARKVRRHFFLYQHYREISPFRGYIGRGKWLEWLPIPFDVVDCEGGRWDSHNDSGADGPAQLLGHGQPDVDHTSSAKTKVRYWDFVSDLYESSGLSPWSPSSSCWA